MERNAYLILVAVIFGVFIWSTIAYHTNKDHIQKLEARVNALEAEDK